MQQCWRAQYHFDIFCSYQRGSAINMSELSLESKYSQLVQESDVWSADLFNYSITGDTPTSLGKALIMCQKGLNCSSCLYDVMAISCGKEFMYSFTDFALTRSHFSTSKQTSVIQKQSNHIPIHHKKNKLQKWERTRSKIPNLRTQGIGIPMYCSIGQPFKEELKSRNFDRNMQILTQT